MIYNNKHVVFEQVGVDSTTYVWKSTVDSGGTYYNNWSESDMLLTHLPTILLKLSNDLQAIITNTTIQTSTNGGNDTLVNTSSKLFLPAEKEVWTTRSYSSTTEFNALITWTYWTTHTTNADHIKYDSSAEENYYWIRSPYFGEIRFACSVRSNGKAYATDATTSYPVASCFCF